MKAFPKAGFLVKAMGLPAALLVLGGSVYLLWRSPELLMFRWFEAIGWTSFVNAIRAASAGFSPWIPSWILYSLPDAVWTASGVLLFSAIWSGSECRSRYFWVFLIPCLSVTIELAQGWHLFPGTFDWMDVAACLFAAFFSWFLAKRLYFYAN